MLGEREGIPILFPFTNAFTTFSKHSRSSILFTDATLPIGETLERTHASKRRTLKKSKQFFPCEIDEENFVFTKCKAVLHNEEVRICGTC